MCIQVNNYGIIYNMIDYQRTIRANKMNISFSLVEKYELIWLLHSLNSHLIDQVCKEVLSEKKSLELLECIPDKLLINKEF
jgi:hypothetical protein